MKVPELSPEVKETFISIIRRNTPTTEAIIYLGESHGGYVFRKKHPKYMKGMMLGMTVYLFVIRQPLKTDPKYDISAQCAIL